MRGTDYPFEIRPSPMQGLGVFATRPIPEGMRLIEYAGERLTPAEAEARYEDVPGERHHTFLFAIDDDVVVDAAVDGNDARFINHSCEPNTFFRCTPERAEIYALRDIRRGEELTVDYGESQHDGKLPCRCGAPRCRGFI